MELKVKSGVNEECKVSGALESVLSCRTMGVEAKRGLELGTVLLKT